MNVHLISSMFDYKGRSLSNIDASVSSEWALWLVFEGENIYDLTILISRFATSFDTGRLCFNPFLFSSTYIEFLDLAYWIRRALCKELMAKGLLFQLVISGFH